jgi:branched-chain amino acid aminotransferase
MTTVVCLDGALVPPEEASISIFDRGFLYGDSVYEVLRAYRGVPFELEAHLERLAGSAARIAMALPVETSVLVSDIQASLKAGGNPDAYLRVVVTRGGGKIGLDPALAQNPRRIVIAQNVAEMVPAPTAYTDGVEMALVDVRRNLREAIDPEAKTGNYLNSVLAVAEARKRGAYEALMLDHRGLITEGSSSNVFLVIGGLVLTPPVAAGILRGVTRRVVLEAAAKAKLRTLEVPLSADTLEQVEEMFLTSSIREVVPVTRIDGKAIGDGRPGPVTRRVQQLFRQSVDEYVAARLTRS